MAFRIGITTDMEVAKWEIERQFKGTKGWKATRPFKTQKEAKDWESRKSEELKCKTVKSIKGPKSRKILWYGFFFEHDGPKKK